MQEENSVKYAERVRKIEPFRVMDIVARAAALEADGHDVVHMEVGEPDFPTPGAIVKAGQKALTAGKTKYTTAQGLPELRECISQQYMDWYGISIDPSRIFVTTGGSAALLLVTAMLLNVDEGFLMTDPGYPCNRHFLHAFEAEPQLVPVTADDHFQLTPALIERHWKDNTRGALIASPANPTGAVIARKDLEQIANAIKERNGYLVVDEIYHGLVYGDVAQDSVLSIDPSAFVVNSFSKYFGMTGWRLGWMVVPPDAVKIAEKLSQNLFICPSSVAQYAALGAFSTDAKNEMERNKAEFKKRRDFLVPALRKLGFGVPLMPEGAFYVYAKLPAGLGSSEAFAQSLLEQHHVAITPGTDFGTYLAEDYARFSYSQDLETLKKGVERITLALERNRGI
ncbi:pyridoxal phosphate-dependent aminotransferase [Pseudomonadales bacterium]|jgi:aspartate/methionine/tyrosine aminotransferase|nr:pyridoxal phosphate-dependent aminotransferase [Pseudomonadales bacterium]MDC1084117.1 pyridoxal phosphate-dependent aminotransferase [Pseudomonadales bacterium]MDC6450219.1 pyridoxal phosphate-dependent aminotransferase [Pseudomonadales bacterium]